MSKKQLEQVIRNAQTEISDIDRDDKAQKLVDNVIILDSRFAKVQSGIKVYDIDYMLQTCSCPDHIFRGTRCKHIRAVNIILTEMMEVN